MKLKSIYHDLGPLEYTSKGNYSIPLERPPYYDKYAYNSYILIYGRSDPTVITQGGKIYKARWQYTVDYEREEGGRPERQVGLKINIQINGDLTNDTEPPNISWAGLNIELEKTSPGIEMLYELDLKSNDMRGTVNKSKEIIIKPILPHPRELFLEFTAMYNVVVDRHPTSWAQHESTIKMTLDPFTY